MSSLITGIKKHKKKIYYFLISGFTFLSILLVFLLHWTSSDIRAACKEAQEEFSGDCVESLLSYLQSNQHTFKEKNHAIWALGSIGDERAVPVLRKYLTGKDCEKPCRTDLYICQYGLKKAIKHCQGLNVMKHVWRWI
jgi:hypothetical protein